jgi:glycosyltransferase involved in cell wall biosynthesis
MKCSVIICTHNPRDDSLRRVLGGLRVQTLPLAQWELLLIDNASAEPLAERFDLSWHPLGRHVRELELGLTPARLRGIRESSAETLVFVDDDTVLAPDYLDQALQVGDDWTFVGVWGGNVLPKYEQPLPDWVGTEAWRLTVVDVKEDVWSNLREGFATIPAGAGMCVRRRVGRVFLERCQGSQQSRALDRTGTALTGYGDVDLAHCAMDIGLGTGKSAKLSLTHLIPAGRLTLDYFLRHAESDAASLMMFRAVRGLPIGEAGGMTLFKTIKLFLHCWRHKIPREIRLIHQAHQRGLKRGLQLVAQYRKK